MSDEQLATLCADGQIEHYQPGPICVEGEPATCFYVLIEGELAMSKLSGGQDIETNRTSHRACIAVLGKRLPVKNSRPTPLRCT